MRAELVKKLRREARRQLDRRTVCEARWWARPHVFRLWALPVAGALGLLYRIGWKGPARWWARVMAAVPRVGIRAVVK